MRAGNAALGALAVGLLKLLRLIDPDRLADFAGWTTRTLGPWLPENRIGRANLAAAFPEKSPAEIEAILRGVWDNLGRLGAEFAQLDRLWDWDPAFPDRIGRIDITPKQIERFMTLANDGKPALVFAAHLANWELPAICAATYRLDSAVLYRRPEHCRDRPLAHSNARREHGRTDPDRARGADADRRGAANAAPMSACWSTSITCAAWR